MELNDGALVSDYGHGDTYTKSDIKTNLKKDENAKLALVLDYQVLIYSEAAKDKVFSYRCVWLG